jgi:hypothetical protein
MSEAYAGGRQEQTRAGGVIFVAVSVLSAVLVIAGLIYALGTGERHKTALAAAQCEPNLSPSGLPCTTVAMLSGQYTAMMTPATQQLNADAAAYAANERLDLAAAESALSATVASAQALDARLSAFPFPPAVAPAAKALIQANQALAALTAEQARSSSFTQLRSFDPRVQAASAAVRAEMARVRKALAIAPTVSQEP